MRPRDALPDARLALEARRRILRHQREFRELRRQRGPLPDERQRLVGFRPQFDALLDQRRPDLARGAHDARQRREQLAQHVVVRVGTLARLRREGHRRRAVGRRVRHRQHDADQRDAVRVAMVDAHDDRAAAVVVVDEEELPHRARGIERRRRELRHELLEFLAARAARKRRVDDVALDVEVLVGLPVRARGRLDGALLEPAEHEEALGDHPPQARDRETLVHQQHAADHHQVLRPVHAQPRGVDRGNLLAFRGRGHGGRRASWARVARVFAFALK